MDGSGLYNVTNDQTITAYVESDGPSMGDPGDALDAMRLLENVHQSVVTAKKTDEAAYVWRRDPDRFSWEANAGEVFGIRNLAPIANCYNFELLIAPEHVARRQLVFSSKYGEDLGNGVPYLLRYRFAPEGARSQRAIWIEENGRWWGDADGKPIRARGCVRVSADATPPDQNCPHTNDYDELTGLLSRTRLTSALAAIINRAEASGTGSAFLMAAVSNLSIINETFGFDVGDAVLARVGTVLKEKLRGGDSIGRYSSNKLGIVLNDCGQSAMRIAADRLIKAVQETTFNDVSCPISVTVSIGGVLLPDHAPSVNQALSRSLEALNQARTRRVSCFVAHVANEEKENQRRRNVEIAEEVGFALDEGRMHLVLQPIVDARTRKPVFHECLLRMKKPDGTIVSAGEFIEVAEQLGIAKLIDQHVLGLAADLLHKDPDLRLSINVSALTCADHDWLIMLYNKVGSHREVARRLIVEITETATINDLDQSIVFVDTVREMGCRVAIDDFGAGYSSFKTLKHLPVDMVKIDGNFVRNVAVDEADRVFLRTMAELTAAFGMETVAEYVIDEPTARIVEAAGITYLQGFHVGHPVATDQVLARNS